MDEILEFLFAPIHWVWGAMSWLQEGPGSSSPLDASSPDTFIALALASLLVFVLAYAMCAFAIHWALTSIAWHWSELLRERAERGTVDNMLDLAVQARRSDSQLYSWASRTGVRYGYTGNSGSNGPELAGADRLPRRRTLGCATAVVTTAWRLVVFLFRLLRAALSSALGLYVLLGTAWTLRPHWFTASLATFHRWTLTWDPAAVPAAVGLIATVLGLIAAYAFSTKRRAQHKSMFDAAVSAENTLGTLGPRAGAAADQVAKLVHIVARYERGLYENAVAHLSEGRLCLQNGRARRVNRGRSGSSLQTWPWRDDWARRSELNNADWMTLCKQREATLSALTALRETSSQVESLSPFARQAGKHSWALLRYIYPGSPYRNPWPEVTLYNEEYYERQLQGLRRWIDRALEDGKSLAAADGRDAVDIRRFSLDRVQEEVEQLQEHSRRCLWHLAEFYARLTLCEEEVRRSRHPRGLNALVARFMKT